MLIGCCHCGETPPSESTPPSQSLPPSTSTSDSTDSQSVVSVFGNVCGYCAVFPRRFSVPITNSLFTFNSRGGTRNNCAEFSATTISHTGTTRSIPMQVFPGSGNPCAVWGSTERAKNTNLLAACADHTISTPRIEMIAQSAGTSVVFTLIAWHWGGSIFGSPTYFGTVWKYTYNPPASGSNCAISFDLPYHQEFGASTPTYTSSAALSPSVIITPG